MKCQILFSGKNKENINLSSAEFDHRLKKLNCQGNETKNERTIIDI